MSLKTMTRNNPENHPGDLMKTLETPGKTGRVFGTVAASKVNGVSWQRDIS